MERQNVIMLTNMYHPPAEGNLCDEYGNAMNPTTVLDCNRYTAYVDSDHMTNSYSTRDAH